MVNTIRLADCCCSRSDGRHGDELHCWKRRNDMSSIQQHFLTMPQYTEQSPELKFLLDLIFIEIHPVKTDANRSTVCSGNWLQ